MDIAWQTAKSGSCGRQNPALRTACSCAMLCHLSPRDSPRPVSKKVLPCCGKHGCMILSWQLLLPEKSFCRRWANEFPKSANRKLPSVSASYAAAIFSHIQKTAWKAANDGADSSISSYETLLLALSFAAFHAVRCRFLSSRSHFSV